MGHPPWTPCIRVVVSAPMGGAPASLRVVGIYISSFNFHCNMPIYYRARGPRGTGSWIEGLG